MKARKLIAAVLAVTVCGALVFAGIAVASGANTKVTIQAQQGGFFGYVHTKKSASEKCENGRKVILYKQKGSEQKPQPGHQDRHRHRAAERPRLDVVDQHQQVREVLREGPEEAGLRRRFQRHGPLAVDQ